MNAANWVEMLHLFFGYVKMCKFISSLIYSTLWLYMSCWWLQFQNSGVRLVQAWTNTRRENQFSHCRCCSQLVTMCVYISFLFRFAFMFRFFLLSSFFFDGFVKFTAIHLNQCYLKETDSKEKVCMLLLMLISFMFLFAGDWQEKESAHSFEIFFLWNVLLFASWTFCFRLNWKWVVWLLCCVEWRPIVNYLEFGREWLWIKSLESLHTCISLDDVDIVNYRHFVELRF